METQTAAPNPPQSPTLKWAPDAKGILAATDDGRLVRFFKSATRTGKPPHAVIAPPHDHYQIAVKDQHRFAQWWICAAFNGKPPTGDARVIFKNGNRSDFRAANLQWQIPKKTLIQLGHAEQLRHMETASTWGGNSSGLASGKQYQSVPGCPDYYTSRKGYLYRAIKSASPKRIRGSQVSVSGASRIVVKLPGRGPLIPLQELIADMWLSTPRPTPYHRAELIDPSDPWNTNPKNLRWSAYQAQRAWAHCFRVVGDLSNQDPGTNSPVCASERIANAQHDALLTEHRAQVDKLRTQGARRLADHYPVWITPAGECLTLDADTAQIHYHQADPLTGKVSPLRGVTLHLPTATADAFHGTPYAPNLAEPCPLSYRVTTLTGDSSDCTPANLIYRKTAAPTLRTVYKFS